MSATSPARVSPISVVGHDGMPTAATLPATSPDDRFSGGSSIATILDRHLRQFSFHAVRLKPGSPEPLRGSLGQSDGAAMNRNGIAIGTILALTAPAVQADGTDGRKVVGRVKAHYVQVARGVFIEARIAANARTAPRWVDVQPVGGAPAVLAHAPEGVPAAVGLLVEVREGRATTRTFPMAETPTVERPAADQRAGTAWLTSSQ